MVWRCGLRLLSCGWVAGAGHARVPPKAFASQNPLRVEGLISPGDRKSVQPMAMRSTGGLGEAEEPRLHLAQGHERQHRLGVLIGPQRSVGPERVGSLEQTRGKLLKIDGQECALQMHSRAEG